MLEKVIDWSLAHRFTVLALTCALAVSGALSFRDLPVDAFPDTTPVQVQINTIAETLSPVEVERQITVPIEQVIAGLPRVEEMRSISKFGLSQITVRFAEGTDLWFARQLITERLNNARLPEGVERPSLGPVATGLGEVFHYIVRGKGLTLEEVRTAHDWIIAPQLRSVPGVAEVNAWGGNEKQWHVVVDPRRLQMFDLTLADCVVRDDGEVLVNELNTGWSSRAERRAWCWASACSRAAPTSRKSSSRLAKVCRSASATSRRSRSDARFAAPP